MKAVVDKKISKIKKELYFNAIIDYIDNNGYKQLKISQLAKSLEISVGTLYNLFGSKEELYLEYLILKFENFFKELTQNETNEPIENLKLYLTAKYKIFIQIDKKDNYPIIDDPFFFHKLDVMNHNVVRKIYQFLAKQFGKIFKEKDSQEAMHLTILFKKLSDGYIESYMLKKFDTTNIVEDTMNHFFHGLDV